MNKQKLIVNIENTVQEDIIAFDYSSQTVTVDLNFAEKIVRAYRIHYFTSDLLDRFEQDICAGIYKPELLEDTLLIDAIVQKYYQYRDDADGGECEMHWTLCLDKALADFEKELSEYYVG